MPVKILMPALSPTMTEGTLAKCSSGKAMDTPGDIIAEIETDKATMEEAVEEGKLGKILVAEGTEGVAVNNVIALLLEEEDDHLKVSMFQRPRPPAMAERRRHHLPNRTGHRRACDGWSNYRQPLARRMASQAGLDLAGITGVAKRSNCESRYRGGD